MTFGAGTTEPSEAARPALLNPSGGTLTEHDCALRLFCYFQFLGAVVSPPPRVFASLCCSAAVIARCRSLSSIS